MSAGGLEIALALLVLALPLLLAWWLVAQYQAPAPAANDNKPSASLGSAE